MMVMMMNRREKDEMTVTGTHHRQVGEVRCRGCDALETGGRSGTEGMVPRRNVNQTFVA